MSVKRAIAALIAVTMAAEGALAAQTGPRPPAVDDPHAVYELQGMSVHPPQGKEWYVFRRDREAVFFGKKLASPTHTFAVSAITQLVERTFTSPQEFLQFIKQAHEAGVDPARQKVIENDAILDGSIAPYCVRYHVKAEDSGAPGAEHAALTMVNYGVTCMHPRIPQLLLDVGYSERGRPGELDAEVRAEGDSVIRSLAFTEMRP